MKEKKIRIGVDVGGTTVKLGLFDVQGTVKDKWEIPTRKENGGEAILPDIAASIKEKLAVDQIVDEDVLGIGIGIPGPIDNQGVVPHTANLGWGRKEVTRELSQLTGFPCKGGNDAHNCEPGISCSIPHTDLPYQQRHNHRYQCTGNHGDGHGGQHC